MKIELFVTTDGDGLERHEVKVDDKRIAGVYPLCECPEDAIIGRDLIDGRDVIRYIKLGYEAAKRGEDIIVTEVVGEAD